MMVLWITIICGLQYDISSPDHDRREALHGCGLLAANCRLLARLPSRHH